MNCKESIKVHVNVEITATVLQAIVKNAKALTGQDEKGVYHVDTADMLSRMISKFLINNDFEYYAKNIDNMKSESTKVTHE